MTNAWKLRNWIKLKPRFLWYNYINCHIRTLIQNIRIICCLYKVSMTKSIRKFISSPDVHEAEAPDVGRVTVIEEAHYLLPGEPQCVEFVQDAECCGDDATCAHTSHLAERRQRNNNINIILMNGANTVTTKQKAMINGHVRSIAHTIQQNFETWAI